MRFVNKKVDIRAKMAPFVPILLFVPRSGHSWISYCNVFLFV